MTSFLRQKLRKITLFLPQMAQRCLPAVLLLLLGFVEAVDIKGKKHFHPCFFCSSCCGSKIPFSLTLDFFSPPLQDFSFKVPRISFANPVLPFSLSSDHSSQLGMHLLASEDEILNKQKILLLFCVAFSPKPFSLNPPLITKTLEFQFAEQSKSNSCDGSK